MFAQLLTKQIHVHNNNNPFKYNINIAPRGTTINFSYPQFQIPTAPSETRKQLLFSGSKSSPTPEFPLAPRIILFMHIQFRTQSTPPSREGRPGKPAAITTLLVRGGNRSGRLTNGQSVTNGHGSEPLNGTRPLYTNIDDCCRH